MIVLLIISITINVLLWLRLRVLKELVRLHQADSELRKEWLDELHKKGVI